MFKKIIDFFTEKKSAATVIPIPQGSFLEFALTGGRITPATAMSFYQTNSTVATAADMIATAIEQIQPVVQIGDDYVNDHPLVSLLRDPNAFETYEEFIGKLSRHYLLTRNSHLLALGSIRTAPVELYAIKPHLVTTVEAPDGYPQSYRIAAGMGAGSYQRKEVQRKARYYNGNLKELYHIMGFSSRREDTQADSPLEAAALETRQQIQGRKHNLSLLNNGGRLSLIVSFNDDDIITDDEHRERKRRINEDLSGPDNAGGIAVTSGASVNIKEVGTSNKDMDFAELDKVAREAIYQRYGIPLPLISTSASTYNNVEQALFDLYENTVLPIASTIFSGIARMLFPRYGLDQGNARLTCNPESIKVIIRQTVKEIKERKEIGIETTNELRSLLPGREPVDGGDLLYQPATLVPIGEDVFKDEVLTQVEEYGK